MHIPKARDKSRNGGLSSAGRSYKRKRSTAFYFKAHVIQSKLLAVIGETDILKRNGMIVVFFAFFAVFKGLSVEHGIDPVERIRDSHIALAHKHYSLHRCDDHGRDDHIEQEVENDIACHIRSAV